MLRQHLRQPSIGHRTFVQISPDEADTAALKPSIHFGSIETPLGFLAAEQATGTVDHRIK
jgi:hypothetical protein